MVRREDLAHAMADAALAVPGVAGLSSSGPVEISMQYAGGKVLGVQLRPDRAEIHIVANGSRLQTIADDVNAAVSAVLTAAGEPVPVTVVIDDITADAVDRRSRDLS